MDREFKQLCEDLQDALDVIPRVRCPECGSVMPEFINMKLVALGELRCADCNGDDGLVAIGNTFNFYDGDGIAVMLNTNDRGIVMNNIFLPAK